MKLASVGLTAIAVVTPFLLLPSSVRADEMSTKTIRGEINAKVESIKLRSKERINELKTKAEDKTLEVRAKACEARKANIESRQSNRAEAANRHRSKFDSIYSRVKNYAADKSISSTEITALETSANAASQKVNEEINALTGLALNIDCSNPDNVAVAVDTYKNQLTSVKNSLKDYRESIRLYAQAVKKVAEINEGAEQ